MGRIFSSLASDDESGVDVVPTENFMASQAAKTPDNNRTQIFHSICLILQPLDMVPTLQKDETDSSYVRLDLQDLRSVFGLPPSLLRTVFSCNPGKAVHQ